MRDIINASFSLDTIECHDEGDGWGSAEPYLWTVFFKIDGTTCRLNDSLNLEGSASIFTTPGSHGNLNNTDVDGGDVVPIPSDIGQYDITLTPIPVPQWVKDLGTDDVAAVAGVICVFMEEDNVSDAGAEAGHAALNNAVQTALDNIVNSLGFTHQEVTDEDISALTDTIAGQVQDAIVNQQNAFENFWSWLNPDDTIGTVVFKFSQDTLLENGTTVLHKHWTDEGDWELNGQVNASVLCSSDALKAIAEIFNALFSKESERSMRKFRDTDYQKYKQIQEWWKLGQRNAPHMVQVIRKNPKLMGDAVRIQQSMSKLLTRKDVLIEPSFWNSCEKLAGAILDANRTRRTVRKDMSRVLDMLQYLKGKNTKQVFETLNAVQPARHPRLRTAGGSLRICKTDIKQGKGHALSSLSLKKAEKEMPE